MDSDELFYKAFASHDPRFDGIFFAGVTSTRIYCRPVCTAKLPLKKNCHFFTTAEAAEAEGFRPCLRCRPELAPGNAPVDDARRIAALIVGRIEEGCFDEKTGLEEIASQFELSSRQIRRILQKEIGVSPVQLAQTRRLLLAKQLLTDTALPVTEIAFASGFSSLRRFNDAFALRYRMPPTRLRKEVNGRNPKKEDTLTLQLAYRPPYDWQGMLSFLNLRAMQHVEQVENGKYGRTVRLGNHKGWITVQHQPFSRVLRVEVSSSLTKVLPALLARIKGLFDLNARPDVIVKHFKNDFHLKETAAANPGLRVPGAFDGFELAVRAVLGQQITVKAATTLAGRFSASFGEEVETPYEGLSRLMPAPERIARLKPDSIARLGIIRTRAESIIFLAKETVSKRLRLEASVHPENTIRQLTLIPGIGSWTAHYIAMRALRWPDSFPKEDIVIRKKLNNITAKEAETLSQAWRPWRSYATLHLWRK